MVIGNGNGNNGLDIIRTIEISILYLNNILLQNNHNNSNSSSKSRKSIYGNSNINNKLNFTFL